MTRKQINENWGAVLGLAIVAGFLLMYPVEEMPFKRGYVMGFPND